LLDFRRVFSESAAVLRKTPTYHLANVLLNGQFAEWVSERRKAGRSWRRIAIELYEVSDQRIDITHETLRTWFLSTNGDEAA
jgi:hypothetical protein